MVTQREIGARLRIGLAASLFLFLVFTSTEAPMAQQQNQTNTSSDDETLQQQLARAKMEKELAEARLGTSEAERKELEARLPKTATKGTEGSVTVSGGGGYYAELLAYRSLAVSAGAVAKRVEAHIKGKDVVLADQFDLANNDALWQMVDAKLADFDGRFADLLARYKLTPDGTVDLTQAEMPAAALVALPAVLGAASDIAAFFRVNREISGRAVTLSSRALIADLAAVIGPGCHRLIIPGLRIGATSAVTTRLTNLQTKRQQSIARRDQVRSQLRLDPARLEQLTTELAAARAELDKLKKENAAPAKTQRALDAIEKLENEQLTLTRRATRWARTLEEFNAVLQPFDALEVTLTGRPAGQTQSPLEAIATVDAIRSLGKGAVVLYVGIVSQGAEVEVTKSGWTSGRISYIGGSVVTYFLVSDEGALVASGSLPAHLADSFRGKTGPETLGAGNSAEEVGKKP